MAILIFVLSLVLLAAGAVGGVQSLDLLPDPLGVLYALAGAVGVAAAAVTFAIGVAILRIDALAKARAAIDGARDRRYGARKPGGRAENRAGAGRGDRPRAGFGRRGGPGGRR